MPVNIVPDASGRFVNGYTSTDDYALTFVPKTVLEGSSTVNTVVDKDITHTVASSEVTWNLSDCVADTHPDNPAVVFSSLSPAICTVTANGVTTPVASGTCEIRATGKSGKRQSFFAVTQSGAGTVYTGTDSIAAGSLRKYLVDQQLAALSGVTPGADAQRANATASDMGFGDGGSVNTNCFIRAQAKSGFDALPQEAVDEILSGGTNSARWRAWISPHHFLTWRGHDSTDGATWRSLNGEYVVEYSATAWGGGTSARLCKLLPENYKNYLPDSANWSPNGGFTPEINVWARFYNTYLAGDKRWVMPVRSGLYVWGASPVYANDDVRFPFVKYNSGTPKLATGGDSGSPIFMGVNGTLVPLGITVGLGGIPVADWTTFIPQINEAMEELNASGDYTVQTVDLSGFTSYA